MEIPIMSFNVVILYHVSTHEMIVHIFTVLELVEC